MSTIEDTGELRQLAEQLHRLERDPRQPGPLDFALAVGATAALLVVGVALLLLTMASDDYPVEPGRVVLTLFAAGVCTAPVLGALFGVNRANRKRFDATMARIEKVAEEARGIYWRGYTDGAGDASGGKVVRIADGNRP